MDGRLEEFKRLLDIMDELRANCPWDKEQTFESLRHLTLEEVYELSDAIMQNHPDEIKKELGDIMLHLVFYSKIGSENGAFTIQEVLHNINEKLIRRHPHIYGEVKVKDAGEVKDNWEKIKMEEGRKSVLEGVPHSLPPLVKAYRIQEKVRGVGFDWEQPHQVWDKVLEEMEELKEEVRIAGETGEKAGMEMEFGDLLFALVNYARFIGVNPDDALEKTNRKFIRRFQYLEQNARKIGKSLHQMSLDEMDVFWSEAKKDEHN